MCHDDYMVTTTFSALCLASPGVIDLSYIDTLPPMDSATCHCPWIGAIASVTARVLLGEVLEREGRHSEAIAVRCARA